MMTREEWRPVVGFPDYDVSSHGRVRRATAANGTQCGKILRPTPGGGSNVKYLTIGLSVNNKQHRYYVHKLVLEAFIGPRPSRLHYGCHNDGNSRNNQVFNLRWDTAANNRRDMRVHGTAHNSASAKLTSALVAEGIRMREQGASQQKIADRFSVNKTTVADFLTGATWRDVRRPWPLGVSGP